MPDSATTQRLDPRPTSPDRSLRPPAGTMAINSTSSGRRKALLGGSLVVVLIIVLTTLAVMRKDNGNANADTSALIYPGAQTVLNMANSDGSRTIHLQTKEPLTQVANWYQTNLKLSKTVRLTSASVVMKKEKVTITLAEEDGTTNVLIKQAP